MHRLNGNKSVDAWLAQAEECELLKENDFRELCQIVEDILSEEPNVHVLCSPITICGDIHGQFYDLKELLRQGGYPPDTKYVFMGDFVDRGYYSIESLTLLLCLKVKWPDHVFLLRGNHECRQVTTVYGFYDECMTKYGGPSIWHICCRLFDYLALGAIIDQRILCVHGGLSPDLATISEWTILDRVREIPQQGPICDLLWSDPDDSIDTWRFNARGAGWLFGDTVTNLFMDLNNLDLICRAHQLAQEGYDYKFNRKLVTVWSAPNYCYRCGNLAAILKLSKGCQQEMIVFSAVPDGQRKIPEKITCYWVGQCTAIIHRRTESMHFDRYIDVIFEYTQNCWQKVQKQLQSDLNDTIHQYLYSMLFADRSKNKDDPINSCIICPVILLGLNACDSIEFFNNFYDYLKLKFAVNSQCVCIDLGDTYNSVDQMKCKIFKWCLEDLKIINIDEDNFSLVEYLDLIKSHALTTQIAIKMMFIIRQVENCRILSDFIITLSDYARCAFIQVAVIVGTSSSFNIVQQRIGNDAMSNVVIETFRSPAPIKYYDAFTQEFLINSGERFPFRFSHQILNALRHFFMAYNFSIASLIHNIKFAVSDHVLNCFDNSQMKSYLDIVLIPNADTTKKRSRTSLSPHIAACVNYLQNLRENLVQLHGLKNFKFSLSELYFNVMDNTLTLSSDQEIKISDIIRGKQLDVREQELIFYRMQSNFPNLIMFKSYIITTDDTRLSSCIDRCDPLLRTHIYKDLKEHKSSMLYRVFELLNGSPRKFCISDWIQQIWKPSDDVQIEFNIQELACMLLSIKELQLMGFIRQSDSNPNTFYRISLLAD
ncbi:hypothetical protein GJ496_010417 [Pomphorhynchus laevis]|nr:hypothetical protein GJ496_010417 [Pomphorhynchus laevis]